MVYFQPDFHFLFGYMWFRLKNGCNGVRILDMLIVKVLVEWFAFQKFDVGHKEATKKYILKTSLLKHFWYLKKFLACLTLKF